MPIRTIIVFLGFIILALLADKYDDNAWTDKRTVNALITEKWEDWSGEAKHPYKVMFAVQITDNSAPEGVKPTTYYERGQLDAREWNAVVPNVTIRAYTTSFKDLGVQPTPEQKNRDWWSGFWLLMLFFVWPIVAMFLLFTWINE